MIAKVGSDIADMLFKQSGNGILAGSSWAIPRFIKKELIEEADIASRALTGIDIGLNAKVSIEYGLIKMYFEGDYSCD